MNSYLVRKNIIAMVIYGLLSLILLLNIGGGADIAFFGVFSICIFFHFILLLIFLIKYVFVKNILWKQILYSMAILFFVFIVFIGIIFFKSKQY